MALLRALVNVIRGLFFLIVVGGASWVAWEVGYAIGSHHLLPDGLF